MTITTFKNLAMKQTQDNEYILSEIESLKDDYELFEEDYAKQWLHENEDWLDEDGINEDALNEMKGQCLEEYCNNEHYRNEYLSDKCINYMKRQLPNDSKAMLEFHKHINGCESTSEIIYLYLKNVL